MNLPAEIPTARWAWLLAILGSAACWDGGPRKSDVSPPVSVELGVGGRVSPCDPGRAASSAVDCPDVEPSGLPPSEPACEQPIVVYHDGERAEPVCRSDLDARELTILDLSSDWAPRVLAGGGELGPVPFRSRYLALARGELGQDATWDRARADRYYELYGVNPTIELVAARLLDEDRHACHDAVPREPLEGLGKGIDTWQPLREQRGELQWATTLAEQLQAAAAALELEDWDQLADYPVHNARLLQHRRISQRAAAVTAAQAHFRCDGLLDDSPDRDGLLDSATVEALQLYLRRHMVITWQIDEEAGRILNSDSRELDFLQLLRSLRERVVDATGLIEDGSAAGARGLVADRVIDTATLAHELSDEPLVGAAPDLVSRASDAAARALGWTSPAAAARSLRDGVMPTTVALRLPALPGYHAAHMDLRIVIDRGDVWYDFPFVPNGDRRLQPRERRPSWVLYARHGEQDVALVRWPTTIGGWQPERLGDGRVKLVYKESPAGTRIVRDLVAAPRWVPPRSTPTRDLMRPRGRGIYVPRYDTFGPSYASAYGLVMLIHQRVDKMNDGTVTLTDQGIRSHGSVSYASIMDGFSHGCHRLHNHRAVRLAGFLLAHREHQVRGPMELDFYRTLAWRRSRTTLHFDSRGYRYELTPAIELEVLPGQIRGWARSPLPPRSLTRPMLKRYR